MQKVLFVASTYSHIRNFHLPYLREFHARGWEVSVACGGGAYAQSAYAGDAGAVSPDAQPRTDAARTHDADSRTPTAPASMTERSSVAAAFPDPAPPCDFIDKLIDLPFEKKMTSPANFRASSILRRLFKTERYDLVITHTSLAAFFARLALYGVGKRPADDTRNADDVRHAGDARLGGDGRLGDGARHGGDGRPRVINVTHGYLYDDATPAPKRALLRTAERIVARKTDLVLAMNAWDYAEAQRFALGTEVARIPGMGVDFTRVDAATGVAASSNILGEMNSPASRRNPIRLRCPENLLGAAEQNSQTAAHDGTLASSATGSARCRRHDTDSGTDADSTVRTALAPMTELRSVGGAAPFVLFYAAEFSARKNQQTLIRAMRLLPPRVHLVLAGDGALKADCERLAAELGVADRITFPGHVTEIGEWLAASDAAVSASRIEGLPYNIMEAMRAALPVVASDVKGHADLIEHGATGLLYPYGDERAFAAQVEALLADPELCRALGAAAAASVERYSLDAVFPQVMAEYDRAATKSM